MRATSLLEKKGAGLDRDNAARHLGAHLCRCTGYVKILDAVELLAKGETPRAGRRSAASARAAPATRASTSRSATSPTSTTSGVDGMLHGAVHLADHARADVVAIDTGRRPRSPASSRVFTAADVPGELQVGLIHKDWPVFIPVGGRTSYLGDVIAIVVAETARAARAAAALVEVEYAPLAPITDPAAAVADDEDAVWGLDGNVLSRSVYARGDVDAAFGASAHVVHDVFQTQRIEHAFLEPESTLAVPQPGGRHARVLGRPGRVGRPRPDRVGARRSTPTRITVELVSNGGAFGGKEDMSNQAQTALAAWLLGPPGEVHAVARGVAAAPPEAPPGAHRPRGRLRRRRAPHRAAGAHARRLGSVRVGRA